MMADDLPFRSQRASAAQRPGPEGAILPFREGRGQTAPGGSNLADSLPGPDALGRGGAPASIPAKVR